MYTKKATIADILPTLLFYPLVSDQLKFVKKDSINVAHLILVSKSKATNQMSQNSSQSKHSKSLILPAFLFFPRIAKNSIWIVWRKRTSVFETRFDRNASV